MDININDPEESSDEEFEETISDEESEETISDEEVKENISDEEVLTATPHLIPLRIHALADPDDNVYGEYLQLFPDSFLTVNNEPILTHLDSIVGIAKNFKDRRQESLLRIQNDIPNLLAQREDFWHYKTLIFYNSQRIINRWDAEIGHHGVYKFVPVTQKAFSNFYDIIEDLRDENIVSKTVINAKNSDLEKLRLELEATKSELEATKSIIIAKNTDLKKLEEKVEFLLEAKKSNKIVNKLPEDLDKKIVKYLGGKKNKTKKILKWKNKQYSDFILF
tara:strand:- start:6889 stop:7722 length:834 start_codon:yes stop_codon:yes gene_type:complete